MAAPKGNQYAKGCKTSGRPRKYKSVEELENAIEYYFNSITMDVPRVMTVQVGETEDGKPILEERTLTNNAGEPIVDTEYIQRPSILGMCQHMGILSETLKEYEGYGEEYSQTITHARERIQAFKIDQLYTVKNPRGVMFDLNVNYGMVEKKEQDVKLNANVGVQMIDDIK